ncbi:MFS transporter [Halomonas stenophila]|uniref:YNFM family putative membrane transporter n=1 Tax=Halomonas stenophila TaxID=795312 RepID=A0A7W5HJE5_9GAMM|nr:MFS transporter [Halomonas stenophila]MBB3229346.1 YNFM family putative membrane transporter [Halomonas stenophila]
MIDVHSRAWWRATLALCLGSFLVFINLYVPQPLLPSLREAHGVSTLAANLVMAVSTLALAASLLVFGPLSDAIGRAGIMRVTLLLSAALSLGLALAPSFEVLLVLRALQGFVLGGLPAVAIAWMGDEFEPPALLPAVGLYIGANSLGGISGRVIGEAAGGLVAHLRNPRLRGAYLLGGLNFLVFINQYSYIAFRLSEAPFGLGARWLGLLFLTYLGGTLGSSLSGRLSRRLSPPACMALGTLVLMGGTLMTLAGSLVLILAGLTVNAFGFFLAHSMASSWVGRQATRARGSASALYLVFYYTGASLGGLWLEPFWRSTGWPGVVLGSWLVLGLTLSIALRLWRDERRSGEGLTGCATDCPVAQWRPLGSASLPQISSSRSERPQADL